MSETRSEALLELAQRFGVAVDFDDWRGARVEVAAETLRRVLAALDVDASSDQAAEAALARLDELPWHRALPPSTVLRQGSGASIVAHVPDGAQLDVEVEREDGTRIRLDQLDNWEPARTIDGISVGEASFRLPTDLPNGWHRILAHTSDIAPAAAGLLGFQQKAPARVGRRAADTAEVGADGFTAEAALIVVPTVVAEATEHSNRKRWGVMAQLYQARSNDSWGLGDLGDLDTLVRWGGAEGADFVLVNPFHAASPVTPLEPSPYLPTSRRFLDAGLIRIDDVEVDLTPEQSARIRELAAYARVDVTELDRDRVWLAKREALSILFGQARRNPGAEWNEFGAFCEAGGEALINFATWCVLAEQFGSDWRVWPIELQTPASPEVAKEREANAERVEFYCWLQWVVTQQSERVQRDAEAAGMHYGVMHDLAVGVHPSGADAWALDDSLARGVSVGAPPDAFNQRGQNWSQPPLRPDALARTGYAPLRDMLRTAFTGAGALRIDHILGFFRLWWIPEGASPGEGTYVRYDDEAMIGILLLEAERAGALVIGEDLGVVSTLTREVMTEREVFGTQIMWFEHEPDGEPLAPEHYRERCLATVTTHDLPPTAGYLEFEHVRIRSELGLLTRGADEELAAERTGVDARLEQLRERGLLGESATTEETVVALHRLMASSASRLFGVALADLAGDRRPINQPGTFREYPNWSLPLANAQGNAVTLEEVLTTDLAREIVAASKRS